MREKDLERLLKSDPKMIRYCIKRILADEEIAKIMRRLYREEAARIESETKSQ